MLEEMLNFNIDRLLIFILFFELSKLAREDDLREPESASAVRIESRVGVLGRTDALTVTASPPPEPRGSVRDAIDLPILPFSLY